MILNTIVVLAWLDGVCGVVCSVVWCCAASPSHNVMAAGPLGIAGGGRRGESAQLREETGEGERSALRPLWPQGSSEGRPPPSRNTTNMSSGVAAATRGRPLHLAERERDTMSGR